MGGAALTKLVTDGNTMTVPVDEKRITLKPDEGKANVTSKKTEGDNPGNTGIGKTTKISVMTPIYSQGGELSFKTTEKEVPEKADKYVFAINEFLSAAKVTETAAKATTAVVRGKVLYIEFTDAFATGYGTEDEETLVNGVCRVAGQFKEVNEVQFMSGGKPINTLGSVDLSSPLSVQR